MERRAKTQTAARPLIAAPVEVAPPSPGSTADDLMPLVYEQLRTLAASYLKRERSDQMLEPSALVHETYLRLSRNPPPQWTSPNHFFAVAASAMRKVLIDHARRRRALKRGFGQARVSFELVTASGQREVEMQELDEALARLAEIDERAERGVELRFFAGLTHDQVATVLGVSRKTVVNDWLRARAWLADALSGDPARRDRPMPPREAGDEPPAPPAARAPTLGGSLDRERDAEAGGPAAA
jgi:RNA polymerase sigma factor (TIGR02999 family)